MNIIIINGPNLNLLGKREPEIYGSVTFEDYLSILRTKFKSINISYFQSNHEGEIIDYLHNNGFNNSKIILNAGAYTHTSIAIADAVSSINSPVIEVHISNVYKREDFRKHSFISNVAKGVIVGFGLQSYELAILSYVNE